MINGSFCPETGSDTTIFDYMALNLIKLITIRSYHWLESGTNNISLITRKVN